MKPALKKELVELSKSLEKLSASKQGDRAIIFSLDRFSDRIDILVDELHRDIRDIADKARKK